MRLIAITAAALLASCHATSPQRLQRGTPLLLPAVAPAELSPGSWQQRLVVERAGRQQPFDALLEIDRTTLRMVAFAGPREAFRLVWDGVALTSAQAEWLPQNIDAERVLGDILLVSTPTSLLRARLPPGWSMDAEPKSTTFAYHGTPQIRIDRQVERVRIAHLQLDLRLHLVSQALQP